MKPEIFNGGIYDLTFQDAVFYFLICSSSVFLREIRMKNYFDHSIKSNDTLSTVAYCCIHN